MANIAVKKVTVNIPQKLLDQAQKVTSEGITQTIITSLELLKRRRAYPMALKLKGKLNLDIDLETSRERSRG